MKYFKPSALNKSINEQYLITGYNVSHTYKRIEVILTHLFLTDSGDMNQETNTYVLNDDNAFIIDPNFQHTEQGVKELEAVSPGFNSYDPRTWILLNLPKIEKPERKHYTRISSIIFLGTGFIEKEMILCLIEKGILPSGDDWTIGE